MVQFEIMSTNNLSDVKMIGNWRVPNDENWRSSGPRMPRYFNQRYSNLKSANYDFPTLNLLNKMMYFRKWNFNLCNTQDYTKICSGKVDFYPDFEGITKIVQDTFANSQNINCSFDKCNISKGIFNHLSKNKLPDEANKTIDNELKSDSDNLEMKSMHMKKEKTYNIDNIIYLPEKYPSDLKSINKEDINTNKTDLDKARSSNSETINCSADNMIKKNMKNFQKVKHKTNAIDDIQLLEKPNLHSKKKNNKSCNKSKSNKKVKTQKHKRKSDTMNSIMEDYYNLEEDQTEDNIFQSSDSFSSTSCSNKLSQSIEKCWNYIQNLPSVKQIHNVLSISQNVSDEPKNNEFVYVHSLDDGHLATECFNLKSDDRSLRRRMPSECETEDSFVVFIDDNQDSESNCLRKPSLCDSNDSFVICFGESSQSPEECFTFDDITDRSSCDSDSSYYEEDSESDSESDISCIDTHNRNSLMCNPALMQDEKDNDSGNQKHKKVRFDEGKPVVHRMITWSYAYQQARKGEWEQFGRDRVRFEQRIQNTKLILDPILKNEYRKDVFDKRFKDFDLTENSNVKNNNCNITMECREWTDKEDLTSTKIKSTKNDLEEGKAIMISLKNEKLKNVSTQQNPIISR